MRLVSLIRRALLFVFVGLLAVAHPGCLDDAPDPGGDEPASLRRSFPEQAAQVLQSSEAFVRAEHGFARNAAGPSAGFDVDLPGKAALVDPSWVTTDQLGFKRYDFSATLLADGEVLVAGGTNASPQITADRYDPMAGTWSPTGNDMGTARAGHASALLLDGRVLATGGLNANFMPTAEADLYNPAANTWAAAEAMGPARSYHTATRLNSGKVLVAGGDPVGPSLNTGVLYDPVFNTWSPTANNMTNGRSAHTATLLLTGQVLVTGGYSGSTYFNTADLYDPASNTWTEVPGTMANARSAHTATLLSTGHVLVAGGFNGAYLSDAQIYDPVGNSWSPAGTMSSSRAYHAAVGIPNDHVLAVGGLNSSYLKDVDEFDPINRTWSPAPSLLTARAQAAAILLGNGDVLVPGGYNDKDGALETAELYFVGIPCILATDCQSGFCTDGVCCDTACNAGPCDACSVVAGAAVNGTCALFTGPTCDDGNGCTLVDTCQAGVCTGSTPITCRTEDACRDVGTCDPTTGACSTPAKPNGTPCDDGDVCTQTDACQDGACAGANPVTCPPPDACHLAGTCNSQTGSCSYLAASSDTVCVAETCQGTVAASTRYCDGEGNCRPGETQECAPFACAKAVCASSCTPDTGCAPTAVCANNECLFDPDGDRIGDPLDNCPNTPSANQTDTDDDGLGDPCDDDDDGDGILDAVDICPLTKTQECRCPSSDGTCDDGNACTLKDSCDASNTCKGGALVDCSFFDTECKYGLCNPASGACLSTPKPATTPCTDKETGKVGVCFAGGCFTGVTPTGASSSASASSGSGAGSGGGSTSSSSGSGTPSGGSTATSTGSGASTDAGTGAGGVGAGGAGADAELRLGGGACSIDPASGAAKGAPWVVLGLATLARRRRREAGAGRKGA
jgi:MYXO-CTERM domain-containing protein